MHIMHACAAWTILHVQVTLAGGLLLTVIVTHNDRFGSFVEAVTTLQPLPTIWLQLPLLPCYCHMETAVDWG